MPSHADSSPASNSTSSASTNSSAIPPRKGSASPDPPGRTTLPERAQPGLVPLDGGAYCGECVGAVEVVVHPHDLAVTKREHDARLTPELVGRPLTGNPDAGRLHRHDDVVASCDQLDRLDRWRVAHAGADAAEHLLAVLAQPLGLHSLVDGVRSQPVRHGRKVAAAHRIQPVGEDDLEVAFGSSRHITSPEIAQTQIAPQSPLGQSTVRERIPVEYQHRPHRRRAGVRGDARRLGAIAVQHGELHGVIDDHPAHDRLGMVTEIARLVLTHQYQRCFHRDFRCGPGEGPPRPDHGLD